MWPNIGTWAAPLKLLTCSVLSLRLEALEIQCHRPVLLLPTPAKAALTHVSSFPLPHRHLSCANALRNCVWLKERAGFKSTLPRRKVVQATQLCRAQPCTKALQRRWEERLLSLSFLPSQSQENNSSFQAPAYSPVYYSTISQNILNWRWSRFKGIFPKFFSCHVFPGPGQQLWEAHGALQGTASCEFVLHGFPGSSSLGSTSLQQQPRDTSLSAQLTGLMRQRRRVICSGDTRDLAICMENVCCGLLMRTTRNVW